MADLLVCRFSPLQGLREDVVAAGRQEGKWLPAALTALRRRRGVDAGHHRGEGPCGGLIFRRRELAEGGRWEVLLLLNLQRPLISLLLRLPQQQAAGAAGRKKIRSFTTFFYRRTSYTCCFLLLPAGARLACPWRSSYYHHHRRWDALLSLDGG